MQPIRALVALALAACTTLAVAQVPKPTKAAAALPEGQKARYQEALAMADAGHARSAAEAFEAMAGQAPGVPQLYYQAARCYGASQDYGKALAAALEGADYNSPLLGKLYLIAAESYYKTDRVSQAVPFFQAAIAMEPDSASAYYELGVAYASLKQMEEARVALKAAAALAPDRPDPNYALGVIWSAQGYKIPALLALCRFLVLEPEGDRARGALKAVSDSLDEIGGTFGMGGPVKSAPDNAEGDFTVVIGAVATSWKTSREDPTLNNWTRVTRSVGSLFARLARPDSAWKGSFTASFYGPYFTAIAAQELTDPFCAHIYRSANNDLVDAYLKDHSDKVYQFLKWSQDYHWPRPAGAIPAPTPPPGSATVAAPKAPAKPKAPAGK
jgi:tetratricopeptide (TPR) repeat protein